jgi:predicted nucleotide-binding protein
MLIVRKTEAIFAGTVTKDAIQLVSEIIRGFEEKLEEPALLSAIPVAAKEAADQVTPSVALHTPVVSDEIVQPLSEVFVVHGHDGTLKSEVARFIEKMGFEAIILHERRNKGRVLITKFREEAASTGFAVVLMTPDDLGKAKKASDLNARMRQNVVFELGFFIAQLGPERVVALVQGDIELPSDLYGVVSISVDTDDWRTKLGSELQSAGYKFDWNKVMGK